MARPRHKHVLRKPCRRRLTRVGLSAAAVLALGKPATAVVWPDEEPVHTSAMVKAKPVLVRTSPVPMRVAPITRSEPLVRLQEKPPSVVDHLFATAPLDVRTKPSDRAKVLDVLKWSEKIGVSGETRGPWTEVVIGGKPLWVHGAYLAQEKPASAPSASPSAGPTAGPTDGSATPPAADAASQPGASPTSQPGPGPTATPPSPTATATTQSPATSELSTAPCDTGSAVESGLVPNAITVHRAVCGAFPQIKAYDGLRPGDPGEHGTGHALDIMVADSASGEQIAAWVRSHASKLGVSQVIWAQHIWTVQRSSEGWRLMPDRGSATANHYDNVHVTVY